MPGGAYTATLPLGRTPFTANGPTGYGPRNFGSLAFGRNCRALTVTTQSAGTSAVGRITQGLLGSAGFTTVAAPVGRGTPPPVVSPTSAFAGRVICHSRAAPRGRSLATVSTCASSTRTCTSVSAVSPGSAGAVPGGSQLTSRKSVGPSGTGLAASCSAVVGVRLRAGGSPPRVPTFTFATPSAGGLSRANVLMAAFGKPRSNPTSPFVVRADTGTSACTVTV